MLTLVSRGCQGNGGSNVCVGDVAGRSKWSSFVGRKCAWSAQEVGSFVKIRCVCSVCVWAFKLSKNQIFSAEECDFGHTDRTSGVITLMNAE